MLQSALSGSFRLQIIPLALSTVKFGSTTVRLNKTDDLWIDEILVALCYAWAMTARKKFLTAVKNINIFIG